jgi:hypothetical protein
MGNLTGVNQTKIIIVSEYLLVVKSLLIKLLFVLCHTTSIFRVEE